MVNYYVNICDRDECSLVHKALNILKTTDIKESWYGFLKYIVEITGYKMPDTSLYKESIIKILINISNAIYIKKLKDNSCLKLYTSIKTHVARERYLSIIKNESYRKSVTRIRLSCHKFPIQTGRYKNIVQDKYHCIMECFHPEVTILRNNYLENIYKIKPAFKKFNRTTLFKYIILVSDTNIINLTSKFLHDIDNMYK